MRFDFEVKEMRNDEVVCCFGYHSNEFIWRKLQKNLTKSLSIHFGIRVLRRTYLDWK